MFLADFINGYLLSADMPETLALFVFCVSLIAATAGLRRLLNHYDEKA